jgi:DUF1680 family protein
MADKLRNHDNLNRSMKRTRYRLLRIRSLYVIITLVTFCACSTPSNEKLNGKSDPAYSFDLDPVMVASPAEVQLLPGGRFYSRYRGNMRYVQFQLDHYGEEMLDAFASRHYSPGKLLERVWDGEYAGKWLDAATRTAVNTGNDTLLALVDQFAASLVTYQQEDGYLGIRLPTDRKLNAWEKEWDTWNLWNALNGLLTHYEFRGAQESLEAASAIGSWIISTYGPLTRSSDPFLKGEIIGAFTNVVVTGQLVRLYRHTGNREYLDFVGQVIAYYPPVQQMLSTGEPYLIHPYMLSALLEGVVAFARETENQEMLQTVERVWDILVNEHLFPTGSLGEREDLSDDPIQDVPGGQLQETCATTEWIFLNTLLYEVTGRVRYINALEKTLYNALLAAQSSDGMKWCYWTPLRYSKDWFHGPTRCCFWSGPRGIARIPQLIYAIRENIIYVNLYESSQAKLSTESAAVTIIQQSEFPGTGRSKLTVKTPEGWNGTLRLRVPDWATEFRAGINGKHISGYSTVEGYLDIPLKGTGEHRVLAEFGIPLVLEPLTGDGYVIRRGPEVMAIDIRDNIDTWLGSDDLISIPSDISFMETESFSPYSWPGPESTVMNRRRYRVKVEDVRTDEPRSVILTPYADAGNEGAAFRTVFPMADN